MGLGISKASEAQYNPCFISILEDIPGGGTIAAADLKTDSEEIKAGAVVGVDSSGLYHLCKSAEVYASGSGEGNKIKITKDHELKAGEFVCNGAKSTAIVSIDSTTSDDYDELTVVSGFAHDDGDYLYESTSEGTEAANIAQLYTPAGLTRDNIEAVVYSASGKTSLTNISSGIVVRGTVNESLLPFVVPDVTKTALTARIRFA